MSSYWMLSLAEKRRRSRIHLDRVVRCEVCRIAIPSKQREAHRSRCPGKPIIGDKP